MKRAHIMDAKKRAQIIAAQNDLFRTDFDQSRTGITGEIRFTSGIEARGSLFAHRVIEAVKAFDAFSAETDPYGQHDFGAVDVDGTRVIWKIVLFGSDYKSVSPDPLNTSITRRILKIMLASEYGTSTGTPSAI